MILTAFAAGEQHPGAITVFTEILYRLVLEIAAWVAVVGPRMPSIRTGTPPLSSMFITIDVPIVAGPTPR